ncbi:ABC transporter permease [Arthrobacter agilis]|uniref:ABC transporter permease n=1 Tax=Arthrobacter agilis TaxID=37921 RepID=UPI000B35072D|nr:ABC transporter permease [Arthrobacter agilis]OUM43627.1 ABC transporter permease [Arthrobacter agilis]PPB46787.1 ABC transporter permease [Arthrobacter agilis]TPV24869.1 ABC transporter permease [Arthrobacter agilis]VDR31024.1 Ribose transport system permease protein rbsC [Arthrobacter agilis]
MSVATGRSAVLEQNRSPRGERVLRALRTPSGAIFVLVAVLFVAVLAANPSFGEPGSLIRFIGRTAPIAIAAIGQYFVIVSGEFDLSMGSVVTAQVIIAGNLIGQDEARALPVLALMLVFGAFVGLVNGLVTTLLRVPSFIVTLGTMLALLGLVLYWTGGAATGNPADSFRQIGRGGIRDVPVLEIIPYPVLILAAVAAGAFWLMRRPYGRTLVAVGDNAQAAALTGAPVWWIRTRAFMLSSLAATVAGIILVGYAGVHPSVGRGYEFTAITAVVLGGVVLGGGRGWVLSAAAGAFALELLFTLLNFVGVQSTWRDSVQGAIIILAVGAAAQNWQRRRRTAASPTHDPNRPIEAPRPTPGTTEGGT